MKLLLIYYVLYVLNVQAWRHGRGFETKQEENKREISERKLRGDFGGDGSVRGHRRHREKKGKEQERQRGQTVTARDRERPRHVRPVG